MAIFAAKIGNLDDGANEDLVSEDAPGGGGGALVQLVLHVTVRPECFGVKSIYLLHP
jgi:hypothetical protein